MGVPEMAVKHKNPATQVGDCRNLRRPDPDASGGGWPENFTGVVVWSSSFSLAGTCCDALKPGGPLTTRQPAEHKWRSGYPTPL